MMFHFFTWGKNSNVLVTMESELTLSIIIVYNFSVMCNTGMYFASLCLYRQNHHHNFTFLIHRSAVIAVASLSLCDSFGITFLLFLLLLNSSLDLFLMLPCPLLQPFALLAALTLACHVELPRCLLGGILAPFRQTSQLSLVFLKHKQP